MALWPGVCTPHGGASAAVFHRTSLFTGPPRPGTNSNRSVPPHAPPHKRGGQHSRTLPTVRDAPPSQKTPRPAWLPRALAVLLGVALLVPWDAHALPDASVAAARVDEAFMLAMPELLRTGARFGAEIVFTYGPLGVLSDQRHLVPSDWLVPLLVLRAIMVGVLVLGWCRIVQGCPAGWKRWTVGGLAIACALLALIGGDQVLWLGFALGAFTLGVQAPGEDRTHWQTIALGAIAGVASLVKFNFFVLGAALLAALALHDLVLRRRAPWPSLAFALALVASWLAAGQRLQDFPVWVAACLELSAGYGDAMSKGFVAPYSWPLVGAFALALATPPVAMLARDARAFRAWIAAGAFGFVAFVSFKHAFAGNQIEQAGGVGILLAAASLAISPRVSGSTNIRRALPPLAVAGSVGVCVFVLITGNRWMPGIGPFDKAGARAGAFARTLIGSGAWRSTVYRDRLEALRIAAGIEPIGRTIDIIPDSAGLAVAIGDYTPRPAFLGINTHTETLAKANAAFLLSPGAPETVLFEITPSGERFHSRLPSTVEGPAWLALWSRYAWTGRAGPFLRLDRLATPRSVRTDALADATFRLGESIEVPSGDAIIWCTIDPTPTLAGRAVGAAYKLPHLEIVLTTDAGEHRYQFVPELGRAGFVVSPLVETTAEFGLLMATGEAGALPGKGVRSLRVEAMPDNGLWRDELSIAFERVAIDAAPARWLGVARAGVESTAFGAEWREVDGGPALFVHAPSVCVIDVPAGARRVTAEAVVLPSGIGDTGSLIGDGVIARVAGEMDGGERVVIAEAELRSNAARVRLEGALPEGIWRVRFEFDPGANGDPAYDHSAWVGIAFE